MKKKIFIIVVILILIILLLAIATIGIVYLNINNKVSKITHVEIDETEIEVNEGVEENLEGFRNIVLLGIDSREDIYSLGNRSDCIIIASINQATKEIKLVSVYRDTYLEITGRNLDKVNHAYSFGGPTLTMSTLNKNLDLDITEFVTVNFEAVAEAVNLIGGVEIEITNEELKYINNYINATSSSTGIDSEEITVEGKQLLDGIQAVAYSRIRYTSGGDYKRTERMRIVLMAILEKAKTRNVFELSQFANEILPKISTNIKANEIMSLLSKIATYKVTESMGWPYNTKGATINSIWYGPPVTLESNVIQLHERLFNVKDYEATEIVKEISKKIIDKTGYKE